MMESRKLLLGEAADPATRREVHRLVLADPLVERARPPLTMHFGPDHVLVYLGLDFAATASSGEVTATVARIERRIRERFPAIKQIFIEAEALRAKGVSEAG